LISSLLDLAGIGLIAPYVALIINPELFLESDTHSFLVSIGFSLEQDQLLVSLGITLIIIFLLKAVSSILILRSILKFSFQQEINLRSYLMFSYQHLPYSDYLQRNSSEYIHAIQSLTSQFSNTLQMLLRLISESLVGLVILIMLAWSNIQALSLLILLLGGVIIIYDSTLRPKVREYGKMANYHAAKMLQGIHEGMEGLKEIRILGNENYFHQVVDCNAEIQAKISVAYNVISAVPRHLLELILITFVVLLVIGSISTGYELSTLLPVLSMFGVAAMRLAPSANQIISGITQLRFNRHGTSILYDDLSQIKGELTNDREELMRSNEKLIPFQQLELKKCSFSYPSTEEIALEDISMIIKSGDTIGLIGSSGAGKTTLVDLILGLLEPGKGEILYNGFELESKLLDWRSNVAYLPQQVFLIDNTLRCNVAMGVEEDKIDDNKLEKALRQARLDKLAGTLPQGTNTLLGERGIRLSGGQRQRIALARAFYFGRDVLVMDESTSALDNETEHEIVEEIRQLKGEKTIIVIAHRLTTLQHCDQVYRLENGKIIEYGSYNKIVDGNI